MTIPGSERVCRRERMVARNVSGTLTARRNRVTRSPCTVTSSRTNAESTVAPAEGGAGTTVPGSAHANFRDVRPRSRSTPDSNGASPATG
jgi:hypothetical protein